MVTRPESVRMRHTAIAAGLAAILLPAPILGAPAMPDEAAIRRMFGVDPGADVTYRNAAGETLDFEQFISILTAGNSATLSRLDDGNVILEVGPREPARPPPTSIPDLPLTGLDGQPIRLDDFGGRQALISFFFAECVPCIEEVPALNDYAQRNPRIAVLAITFDKPAVARQFAAEYGFDWPIAAGAEKFLDAMGVVAYPSYALLDSEGELLGFKSGLAMSAGDGATTAQDIAGIVNELRAGGADR